MCSRVQQLLVLSRRCVVSGISAVSGASPLKQRVSRAMWVSENGLQSVPRSGE